MIYILEGIDGSGKTTLMNEVKDYYETFGRKAIFIKESVVNDVVEKEARVQRVKQLAKECNCDVFYDRATIIDDFVYQPLMDNESSQLSINAIDVLKQVTIIHIKPDIEECFERIKVRGDEYIPLSKKFLTFVEERYMEFYHMNNLKVRTIKMGSVEEMFNNFLTIVRKKDFKVAHIVPNGSLELLQDNMYAMCLAHLAKVSDRYANFYKHFPGYVLMDNGAAENEQLSFSDLLITYERVRPSEIVIPDTLCDLEDTMRKKDEFMKYIKGKNLPYKLMAVPQGKTFDEWQVCASYMVADKRINTIGVSKFLEMQTKNPLIRYKAVAFLKTMIELYGRYDLEVHLLGCSERPDIIKRIHEDFDFVRGCDSAIGYICTQANVQVYGNTSRPKGEIDFLNGEHYDKLQSTLQDLEIAMGCYDNGYSSNWED